MLITNTEVRKRGGNERKQEITEIKRLLLQALKRTKTQAMRHTLLSPSHALRAPDQHTDKRRRKCTGQSRSCLSLCQIFADLKKIHSQQ